MRRTALALVVLATPTLGQEPAFTLKDGPGRDVVSSKCVACHSLDYIQMNSVFLDRKGWERTVDKMIKGMGANVTADEAKVIVDYLTENYGVKTGG